MVWVRVALACISGSSGIDTYTRLLASALDRTGHDVLVFTRTTGRPQGLPDSVETVPLRPLRHRVRRFAGAFEATPLQRTVRLEARRWGADVVHAPSLSLAPPRAHPLVVNAWDPELSVVARVRLARSRGQRAWPEALYAVSDAIGCRRGDAVIAVTPPVAEAAASRYRRVEWLPLFMPDESVSEAKGDRDSSCVMVANYLDHPRKNLDLAVEAVRVLRERRPDVRLVLVGGWLSDERRGRLPGFCEAVGRLSSCEVLLLLGRSGCCLLPSMWEEFGYSGLEALAAGSPLVCGPLPAFEEVAEGVVVFDSLESQAVARALEGALELRPFRFPELFRESAVVPRIVDLYRSIA